MTLHDCTIDMFNGPNALRAMLHLSDRWTVAAIQVENGVIGTLDDDDPSEPIIELERAADLKDIDTGKIVIDVRLRHGLRHICPHCGKPAGIKKWVSTEYDTAPMNGMKCVLRVRSPQLHCDACSCYTVVPCPLVRRNCTYTKDLEVQILRCLLDSNFKQTAEQMMTSPYIVTKTLSNVVNEGLERRVLGPVTELYVDEIHFGVRDGKDVFITVFSDQNHDLLYLTEEHTQACMMEMRDLLESNGRRPKDVKYISMDMAKPFKAGAEKYFPKARIILDRFHLMKNINEALEKVRKRTYRELDDEQRKGVGRIKYTVLYNSDNLPEKHKGRMESIRLMLPELALAYDLKEEFRTVFECRTRKKGRKALEKWFERVVESGIEELITKGTSIMERLDDILPWFTHRMSNGVAEGLNNKLQKIKSDSYGFRHPANYINFAYFRKARIPIVVRRPGVASPNAGHEIRRTQAVPCPDVRRTSAARTSLNRTRSRRGQRGAPGATCTASPIGIRSSPRRLQTGSYNP